MYYKTMLGVSNTVSRSDYQFQRCAKQYDVDDSDDDDSDGDDDDNDVIVIIIVCSSGSILTENLGIARAFFLLFFCSCSFFDSCQNPWLNALCCKQRDRAGQGSHATLSLRQNCGRIYCTGPQTTWHDVLSRKRNL